MYRLHLFMSQVVGDIVERHTVCPFGKNDVPGFGGRVLVMIFAVLTYSVVYVMEYEFPQAIE